MTQSVKLSQADVADKYALYLASVQEPEAEVDFFVKTYKSLFKASPKMLREDFCGTFAVCCDWVKRGKGKRQAIGVDLDPEPLDWGREHHLSALTPKLQKKIRLVEDDVRTVSAKKADVLAAQNFSFWLFKTRDDVLNYFEIAHQNMAKNSIMVLDMMGGSECYEEGHEDIRIERAPPGSGIKGKFKYVWEQARYDPITHNAKFHIHFRFRDGSELSEAFTYDWRFWTIAEVRELLAEAGFTRSYVYWEGTDHRDGEGNGVYTKATSAPSDPSWVCYIVAVKGKPLIKDA